MAASGFGAGIAQGLIYQQQRRDELDRQAEEMALRNAMQRLNEKQFTHEQGQDEVRNQQFQQRQGLDQQQFGLEQQKFKAGQEDREYQRGRDITEDTTGLLKSMIPQGFAGPQIYPLTTALKSRDMNVFNEAVKNLTMSPLLSERNKQAWARLEKSLQGEDLKFFRMTRDTLYNSGGITWDDANQEALIQLHGMRAHTRLAPQGEGAYAPLATPQQPGSVPVPGEGQGSALQPPDLSQWGGAGRDFGVNARVNAQNKSRDAFTKGRNQATAFNEKMNPIKVANAKLAGELSKSRKAKLDEEIDRMKMNSKYDEIMKAKGVEKLFNEVALQAERLQQMKDEREWRKQSGTGSAAQMRIQQQAETRAGQIWKDMQASKKELIEVGMLINKYTAQSRYPYPSNTDPEFIRKREQIDNAKAFLPGLEAQRQRIRAGLDTLKERQRTNNQWRNLDVQETKPSGKPTSSRPPAVASRPRAGAQGLAKVTPPPGVSKPQKAIKDMSRAELEAFIAARKKKR